MGAKIKLYETEIFIQPDFRALFSFSRLFHTFRRTRASAYAQIFSKSILKTPILPTRKKVVSALEASERPGLILTQDRLATFFESLNQKGFVPGTREAYRRSVGALYQALPADKRLQPGMLDQWQKTLLAEGYSPRTVNTRLSAANRLVAFLGHRELQTQEMLEIAPEKLPELTRSEYLRLLSAARALGKERLYLLVKLFGSTGLPVGDLKRLTVEALRGEVDCPIHLPEFLRRELLNYAGRCGVVRGPLFQTKQGTPLGRTAVTDSIKQLCRDAQVEEDKVSPRCLRRMWQATQAEIRARLERLVEQTCDNLLETEQLSIGWDSKEVRGP